MDLTDVLSDYNCKTNNQYGYEVKTPIGTLQINYRADNKRLNTNFIGSEAKAKLVQGHWKNNTYVETVEDVKNHIESIFNSIERYKFALRQGDYNYGTSR